ncbi:MAG: hypothetical protein ACLQMS_14705 [Desulfomonilaceae bacterium]
MQTRLLSYGSNAASLAATAVIVAIVLCLAVQSHALAEADQPSPGNMVENSAQKSPELSAQPIDQKPLIDSIGTLMDDKLAPLIRMQANLQKLMLEDKFSGPKMTDIVGGIGWIMGLFGIAAFFWSFKRKSGKSI